LFFCVNLAGSNALNLTCGKKTSQEIDMSRIVKSILATFVLSLFAVSAFAAPTDDPGIQKRQVNQEKRIDQGVKSGELTPREAGRLEAQQAKIQQDEARMKADGKLTKAERRKLQREQDRASKNIYRKKHNERSVDVK
jgi:hypothetical protein